MQRCSRLNAVWTLQYALEAWTETTRGLALSDLSPCTSLSMLWAEGRGLDVVCSYIFKKRTTEGVMRQSGSQPDAEPYMCPCECWQTRGWRFFNARGVTSPTRGFSFPGLLSGGPGVGSGGCDPGALAGRRLDRGPPPQESAFRQPEHFRWSSQFHVTFLYHNTHRKLVMMTCGEPDTSTIGGRLPAAVQNQSGGRPYPHLRWRVSAPATH